MKFFAAFFLLIFSTLLFSQTENTSLVIRSFVKEDTVVLRWAPTNADLLIKGLKNGYKIERVEGSATFENNSSLQTFFIKPFSERKTEFINSTDENIREMVVFIGELINSSTLNSSTKSMSFAMLMLAAGSNKEIAKMLGVYFEDVTTNKSTFSYRISINESTEISSPVEIKTDLLSQNQTFTKLSGSSRAKLRQAYLSWEAKSLQDGYSAYWIERSTDSIHFEKRNTVPYLFLKSSDEPNKINCDYVDTGVTEGVTYFYRITGINHFADKGKSSNVIKVYIPKSLYGECRIESVVAEGLSRKLNGHFVHNSKSNELTRFLLFRSDSLQFGYQFLSEQKNFDNTFEFVSSVPVESGDQYYYKVAALSADNDTVYSFPFYFFTLDQVPPQIPLGLSGEISDSGIVSLTWILNPEKDIRGYRIYRSNDLKEEFVEVTKFYCESTIFYDTLSLDNLTSKIYYKIVAVDLNFNNSKRSDPVLLLKPDTIPPVPSIFLEYSVKSNGVDLVWVNSTSEDLAKSVLLRIDGYLTDTLLYWQDSTYHFIDTTGIPGKSYEYIIIVSDRSNNLSDTARLSVNYETGVRSGVSDIKSIVNREEKTITTTWNLPKDEIYSIQIYRAKNDEPFRLIRTIRDKSATSFIDKDLSINNTYKYKIKIVYKSGISSILSDAVRVAY